MSTEETKSPRPRRARLAIWEMLVLVLGAALGIWMVKIVEPELKANDPQYWIALSMMTVGGVAAVGPPLLLIQSRGSRSRWGAGRVLWFSEGAAAWLLWPPIIREYATSPSGSIRSESLCYYYGTPLMAIYMLAALTFGGWIRPRRRRRKALPMNWQDRVGLILSLLWACTGLYILGSLYWRELKR